MEKLFSKEDLSEIELDATFNLQDYLGALIINGEANEKTIVTISKEKQLVIVEGNDDTGYRHLSDRHGYFSFKNHWRKKDSDMFTLDDPSKFHPKMMPVIDFVKVVDAIFLSENKNITKNNRPDIFDKYSGYYCFENEQPEEYHLLTYKDTKIVHTLFPQKRKHNRINKLGYGKGTVTTELRFPEGINDLVVPYENSDGITSYSILIRKYYSEKIERTFIQKHDENGNAKEMYLLGYREFKNFESFDAKDAILFQHADLKEFEKIIKDVDVKNKKN